MDPYQLSEKFAEKVVIVTGASRGIGFAISKIFSQNFMKVYMVSKNERRLYLAVQKLQKTTQMKNSPFPLPVDITRQDAVKRLFKTVERKESKVDILVNNAGIGVFKPFLNTSLRDLQNVINVNVVGAFLCCKEAFNIMKRQYGGCIVNIGSMASLKGYINQSIYSASKHAILGLTKVLAEEGKPHNIKVHCVCPGGVNTDMARQLSASIRPDLTPENLMDPDDIAKTILYMIGVSDKAVIDNIIIRRDASSPYF